MIEPAKISDQGFAKAIEILANDVIVDSHTALLPASVCRSVVDRIDSEPAECGGPVAVELTARLLRNYPNFRANDAKGYVVAIKEMLCGHPLSVCMRAIGKDGILSQEIYGSHPKTSDVLKALKAAAQFRELIRANALCHMQEADNRLKARRAEEEYRRQAPSLETRRRQVAELLGVRSMS